MVTSISFTLGNNRTHVMYYKIIKAIVRFNCFSIEYYNCDKIDS